jgi:hypothetical protein
MKKYLPYIIVFLLLIAGVSYFMYQFSPSTLEKKESDFAIKNIDDVTQVRLSDVQGDVVTIKKNGKKWLVDGKYEINKGTRELLFTALQKVETNYPTPENGEKHVLDDMARQHNKCEIYLNNEDKPSKVYYVGGATADGEGTYMIMERGGQMARHSYVTHIPGVKAYLTGRYYPMEERWRTIWIFRDNDQTIQSLKVTYNREKQKSFEIKLVGKDSFALANSDGQVLEQPKQKFIHQYLNFYDALPLEQFENKNTAARDTAVNPQLPFCTLTMKRTDNTESTVILYYIPVNDQTRLQYDDNGRKLLYDIEHYYILFNDKKDLALIQYYTWGKILHSYQDFFVKPGEAPKTQ